MRVRSKGANSEPRGATRPVRSPRAGPRQRVASRTGCPQAPAAASCVLQHPREDVYRPRPIKRGRTDSVATSVASIVREFREFLLRPLQLERLQDGRQIQKHWEVLQSLPGGSAWSEVEDEFTGDPKQFQERHYHEFVTFLPAVQRSL